MPLPVRLGQEEAYCRAGNSNRIFLPPNRTCHPLSAPATSMRCPIIPTATFHHYVWPLRIYAPASIYPRRRCICKTTRNETKRGNLRHIPLCVVDVRAAQMRGGTLYPGGTWGRAWAPAQGKETGRRGVCRPRGQKL